MKRVFGWWVLVMVLAVSTTASAQPPTAAATLANVQQLYANAKQFTAKFRQTVTNTTFGTTTTSDGALWVQCLPTFAPTTPFRRAARPSSSRASCSMARPSGSSITSTSRS